jgi:hypothetical protein
MLKLNKKILNLPLPRLTEAKKPVFTHYLRSEVNRDHMQIPLAK